MDTRLVRLKTVDKRRGHVLRRFTYRGITFVAGVGWYRVERSMAEQLAEVRQIESDPHSPRAFDVATDAEAQLIDESEAKEAQAVRKATDALPVHMGRATSSTITTADLPEAPSARKPGPRSLCISSRSTAKKASKILRMIGSLPASSKNTPTSSVILSA